MRKLCYNKSMNLKPLILIFLLVTTLLCISSCGNSDSGGDSSPTDETDVPVDEVNHTVEHNNDPMFN